MSKKYRVTTLMSIFALYCFHGPAPAMAQSTARVSEPIILAGSELGVYLGQATTALGVWAYRDGVWVALPSQVDQRDDRDRFVAAEGANVLDANDELVFMADGLGAARPQAGLPPGASADLEPAQITVTDPLDAGFVGYAYVFLTAPMDPVEPAVTYDPQTREVRSESYVLGIADPNSDGFFGLKRLSLAGDERNRLDRSKIRVTIPQFANFTEESLAQLGGVAPIEPVIMGPVRLVMSRDGSSMAYAERATLFNLEIDAQIPIIPGLEFRISLDFSPNAEGATFRAENLAGPVTIDGVPDTLMQLVFPMWREVTFEEARLVMLTTSKPPPLLVRTYYKDDAALDEEDTGDRRSYGDNGVLANSLSGLVDAGFLGQMVVLPPESDAAASDLALQLANPLVVQVQVDPALTVIHLPILTHQ